MDSNQRRLCRRFYRPLPLAARATRPSPRPSRGTAAAQGRIARSSRCPGPACPSPIPAHRGTHHRGGDEMHHPPLGQGAIRLRHGDGAPPAARWAGHRRPSGHSGGRRPNGSRDHLRREVPPARVLGCGVRGQFWCPPRSSDRTSPVTQRVNVIADRSQSVQVERTIESSGSPTGETYRRRIEVQHGQDCPAQSLRLRWQRHRAGGGGRCRHEVVVSGCVSDSRSPSLPEVRSH
jgi:hypothetical protein